MAGLPTVSPLLAFQLADYCPIYKDTPKHGDDAEIKSLLIKSFDVVSAKYVRINLEFSMYVGNTMGSYGGLAGMWGFGDAKPTIVDPKQYIPKKHDILNADQAALYLTRPSDRQPPKKKAKKGGVYWTSSGPQYSRKKIKTGRKAEKVPAPKIKFRPNVAVIRDLPKLDLEPVPGQDAPAQPPKAKPKAKPKAIEGFANTAKGTILPVLVLGLVILGIVSYNKP